MVALAGAWFWTEEGVPTLDTTTRLLQEIVPIEVVSSDTDAHAVALPEIAGDTRIVPQDNSNAIPGDNSGETMIATVVDGELRYQFYVSDKVAEIRALVF